jgi:hypothetical protein
MEYVYNKTISIIDYMGLKLVLFQFKTNTEKSTNDPQSQVPYDYVKNAKLFPL